MFDFQYSLILHAVKWWDPFNEILSEYSLVELLGFNEPIQVIGYILLFGIFIIGMKSPSKNNKKHSKD